MTEQVRTRSGTLVKPEREAWARKQVAMLGITDPGSRVHDDALDAARRGFPAWRIAESLAAPDAFVQLLRERRT